MELPRRILSPSQAEHFLEHHYVVLEECFSEAVAREWVEGAMRRLGADLDRPESFPKPFFFLGAEAGVGRVVDVRAFAPKVWDACCDLMGGEERIDDPYLWEDGFVVNVSAGADRPWQPPDATRGSWHIDGDFNHFLDSPEQGLLVIAIWKEIRHRGGGTFLAADSIGPVARKMLLNPQDVGANGFKNGLNAQCREFVEVTGRPGTVYLMHPFMLHTVAQNLSGTPRVMKNSIVLLKEPMRFDREDPAEFSLVERATLRALGVDRLYLRTPPPERRCRTDHDTDALRPGPSRSSREARLGRITG